MNTISKLILVCTLAFGCATSGQVRSGRELAARRGSVHVDGPSVRAVVVGPSRIHAYSAFAGGAIYAARAVSGTDSDCRRDGADQAASLPADRIVAFEVGAGQVACLQTASQGSFELLWHASSAPAQDLVVAQQRSVD